MKSRFMESNVVDEFHPAFYFEHSGVLQTVAHQLKYNEMMGFGIFLGRKIGELLNARNIAFDLIIPIPLNKRKYRERGYNQSEYIARGIRTVTRKPVLTHGIRRIKNTVTQTHLTAEERKKNMADAFTCSNDVKIRGKKILLVDDVITTGATIEESADVLKKCGAARVVAASAGLAILEKKK
jgi:ComF family protein